MLEKTQRFLLATAEGYFQRQMVLLCFCLSVVDPRKGRLENDFLKRYCSEGSCGWQLPELWGLGVAQPAGFSLLFGSWINIL